MQCYDNVQISKQIEIIRITNINLSLSMKLYIGADLDFRCSWVNW